MPYYAVIDTNVLVSAMLKWNSVPGNILEFAFEGIIVPILNKEIVDEYINVLSRDKFGLSKDIISSIISSLEESGYYLTPNKIDIDLPHPKDIIFYEVVMENRKNTLSYLITGNIKHFPTEPFIVTPRQMLDIITKDVETSN